MRRNLRQSIVKSIGRYIAIVMIIALGAGLFVGLLMTKADMVATGQRFMDQQNMFDLRLMNSYGWDWEHVDAVSRMDGIVETEAVLYLDLIARTDNVDEDMRPASALGMKVFLLTPCLINKTGEDISRYPQGGFPELMNYIRSL